LKMFKHCSGRRFLNFWFSLGYATSATSQHHALRRTQMFISLLKEI
jgi:hypothetical protein